jgi:periplasmic protein TonB
MPTLRNVDPYARNPAKLSNTGKTFALVLALHVGLVWLAQAVWTSEPAKAVREVVAAQLIQEFRAPEPPKLEPAPKTPSAPQVLPAVPSPLPASVSPVPHALPAIIAAPVAAPSPAPVAPAPVLPAPVAPALPAAAKPAPAPVMVAASARMDSCAKPRYPAASERMGEEGVVSLKFLISENGQVLSGSVEKSSGYKRLDDAALSAISLCKFKPATVDGKPRQEWSALRYRWELNN